MTAYESRTRRSALCIVNFVHVTEAREPPQVRGQGVRCEGFSPHPTGLTAQQPTCGRDRAHWLRGSTHRSVMEETWLWRNFCP